MVLISRTMKNRIITVTNYSNMLNKKFLNFRYTAIRRYGEKKWVACDGVIEFNPVYTVNVSTCERDGFSSSTDQAYIVELSNFPRTKLNIHRLNA